VAGEPVDITITWREGGKVRHEWTAKDGTLNARISDGTKELVVEGTKKTVGTPAPELFDALWTTGATEAERALFRQLIKISGIGARTALSVLSGLSVAELREAVRGQDIARMTKIPGIGKKTAERLLLELRDRLDFKAGDTSAGGVAAPGTGDIVNALSALGYNDREVNWAVEKLTAGLSVTEGIRQALKLLSKS
jgi:Holliday junction DNA helicase RuvA subunit